MKWLLPGDLPKRKEEESAGTSEIGSRPKICKNPVGLDGREEKGRENALSLQSNVRGADCQVLKFYSHDHGGTVVVVISGKDHKSLYSVLSYF